MVDWLQLAQYGLSAIIVVAGVRGMYVYRWNYDETVARLEATIADKEQQLVSERAAKEKAEHDTLVMRDMLFESLGVNRTIIDRLPHDGPLPPVTA